MKKVKDEWRPPTATEMVARVGALIAFIGSVWGSPSNDLDSGFISLICIISMIYFLIIASKLYRRRPPPPGGMPS